MRHWHQKYRSLIIGALFGLILLGWWGATTILIRNIAKKPLIPIAPSRVTFLAFSPETKYRIIITNDQPYLVEQGEYKQVTREGSSLGDKPRAPVDCLIKALNGDSKGLGELMVALSPSSNRTEGDLVKTTAHVPVTYKVVGVEKTINAVANVYVERTSNIFKDKQTFKIWEKSKGDELRSRVMPLLNNTEVILTEQYITASWVSSTELPPPLKGKSYTLHFELNNDGRRRLLQATAKRKGEQLIIAADGIPVAAPIIETTLNVQRIDIPNVRSEELKDMLFETLKSAGVEIKPEINR